ncbi:extracellular solute-binding protein [Cohnella soli]|uniref:Extracellular solute-binding protein n=1 Tax=Cohnella soli TaxID=425005 RepID=A0ABW0HX71_9BACL
MKRIISIALLSALILIMIAGCSSNDAKQSSTTEPPSSVASATPAAEPEKDNGTPNPASFSGEISFMTPWPHLQAQLEEVVKAFNKTYPNVKVNLAFGGEADLTNLVTNGIAPELFLTGTPLSNINFINDGIYADLTPYLAKDPDLSDKFPDTNKALDTYDQKMYGLPFDTMTLFPIYYNKKILDQYGYTEFPELKTLGDIDAFFKKFWIVKDGNQEMTGQLPHIIYNSMTAFTTFAYANGADDKTFWNAETKTVNFSDPKVVEALEWMVRFKRENIDDARMQKMNASFPEGTDAFINDKQAMGLLLPASAKYYLSKNPDLQLGVASMPEDALYISGQSVMLVGPSKNKDLGWEFMKWLTSTEEGTTSFAQNLGFIPALKDNSYVASLTDPLEKQAVELSSKAKKVQFIIPVDISAEFDKLFGDVMAGKMEPKAFLDHMTQYTQNLINEAK